ncbi:MAG: dihydrofolate reductase family protein [Minisyncoccota bacterium]
MNTLYNVVSEDGYIAAKDGSEDFIPDELWPITLALMARYDALIMGRKTYDALQKYPATLLVPLESLLTKKIVITRNTHFYPKQGFIVARSPEDALKAGMNILVTSGPTTNTSFLEKKLVDKIIYHQVPVKIGRGIKPFNIETKNLLELISEKILADGVKEISFQVRK